MIKRSFFFGCPLDSDERDESIQEKLAAIAYEPKKDDPYPFVLDMIRNEIDHRLWEEIGSLDVPDWLRPIPPVGEKENINVDNFVSFIDHDGCRTFSEMIGEHVVEKIYPQIPCMLAVDHSLTGGVFKKLATLASPEKVSLVVLDSHTDALPASISSDAISYDMDTNPDSLYDPNDPFLKNRPESYNASSFLYHLLEEGVVQPKNLYIIGIGDYPPKHSFRIKDPRIKRYSGHYSGLKKRGVTLITKKDLINSPSKVRGIIDRIETPNMYISIDMDIGSGNALQGVRFRNRQGLNEKQIYRLSQHLRKVISKGVRLMGMDLNEFNPRISNDGTTPDRACRIASNLIRRICFGLEEIN